MSDVGPASFYASGDWHDSFSAGGWGDRDRARGHPAGSWKSLAKGLMEAVGTMFGLRGGSPGTPSPRTGCEMNGLALMVGISGGTSMTAGARPLPPPESAAMSVKIIIQDGEAIRDYVDKVAATPARVRRGLWGGLDDNRPPQSGHVEESGRAPAEKMVVPTFSRCSRATTKTWGRLHGPICGRSRHGSA